MDGFWVKGALRTARAASEALFPANASGVPDHVATEMADRLAEYLRWLPPPQRRLVVLLFWLVELVLAPRYSRRSLEARADCVRRWRRSRLWPLRMAGDAVKALLTMLYMSHPRVAAYLEMPEGCGAQPRGALLPLAEKVKVAS